MKLAPTTRRGRKFQTLKASQPLSRFEMTSRSNSYRYCLGTVTGHVTRLSRKAENAQLKGSFDA